MGNNLKKFRENSGESQYELAKASGCSRGYIAQIESGHQKLTLKQVLLEYKEEKGSWHHTSIVFGYIIGLGFSPARANWLQCQLKEEGLFGR